MPATDVQPTVEPPGPVETPATDVQPTGEPQQPVRRPPTDSPWLPNCNHVPPDYVEIGRNSYYDPHTVRFVTHGPGERIVIGKYCSIGPFTNICTGGMHLIDLVSSYSFEWAFLGPDVAMKRYRPPPRNTVIGSDVWIGTHAHILEGARVGHGAVVGARAVVRSDVPDYAIVVGNPAVVVRYRFSNATVRRLLRIAWWDWPEEVIRANMEWFYRPVVQFVEHFDRQGERENQGATPRAA
jgi:acetyltransferase-like isoleucine patch superfamily enzyme